MGNQKRISSGASEFTGFSAFASHTSSAAVAVQQLSRANGAPSSSARTSSSSPTQAKLRPNPIYLGNDTLLLQIFKRITKKDSTTKSRALAELSSYAYPCDESGNASETQLPKNEQVAVLSHFFFLFANKLIHDNNSFVRSESMKVLGNAMAHVPKACTGLLRQDAPSLDASGSNVGAIGNIIGWIYSFQSSQIKEVSKTAIKVWKSMFAILEKFHDDVDDDARTVQDFIKQCVVSHAESILQSSSRATNLADALSVTSKKSQPTQGDKKGGKGTKGKDKDQSGDKDKSNEPSGGPSESEREDMEERYERVVLLTIRAMDGLLHEYPELPDGGFYYSDIVNTPSVLWKHLSSPRGSFRRATFGLVSCIAQNATSLMHEGKSGKAQEDRKKSNLSQLILNILSSERDPANFMVLFEMILLYIASFREFSGGIGMAWETTASDQGCSCGMDANAFIKSMSKILRRACYGSPSLQWGKTMLPILATLQSSEQQLQFLTSLVRTMISMSIFSLCACTIQLTHSSSIFAVEWKNNSCGYC